MTESAQLPERSARPERRAGLLTTPAGAVVETEHGKLRGYLDDGVYTYKGVAYGAPPTGDRRFRPAGAPASWTGEQMAMTFAASCPQHTYGGGGNARPRALEQAQHEYRDEDCLNLNIWTSGLGDGRRRPVMVWLHGGAFLMGSAIRPATFGANLARHHDVVVVSLHHRLHALGHLDLSAFGDEFHDAANVGMLDIVSALGWINHNIEAFGGDPSCVTLFGQSGGGAKVATLLAMPAARGLFHRAVIQSSSCAINDAERSERLSERFLAHLGITARNLDDLFELPIDRLVEASTAVAAAPLNPGDDWRPKVDGHTVLQKPFEPATSTLAADIPLMIGGTRHEFAPDPERGPIGDAELHRLLAGTLGGEPARAVAEQLRAMYPGISNNELLALVNVQPFRAHHVRHAEIAAERTEAPTFLYNFAWKSTNLDGLPLAYHGAELPFVFDNVGECAILTGNRPDAQALGELMATAWTAFAASGDPAHGTGLAWEPLDPARRNTMVFDIESRQVDWPWRAETDAVLAAAGGLFAKPAAAALMRS